MCLSIQFWWVFQNQMSHCECHICRFLTHFQGIGNVSECAEFNFHADPEAAHAVLRLTRFFLILQLWINFGENLLRCPTTIATWELSYKWKSSSHDNISLRLSSCCEECVYDGLHNLDPYHFSHHPKMNSNHWNHCWAKFIPPHFQSSSTIFRSTHIQTPILTFPKKLS